MIDTELLQIPGAKEMINVVRTFKSLPRKLLMEYCNNMGFDYPKLEGALTERRYAYVDLAEEILCMCKGIGFTYGAATCFAAALYATKGKKLWFEKSAIQGFDYDYSIEGDEASYQLMYFTKEGRRKLNQFNNSIYPYDNIVPVIVVHNSPLDVLYEGGNVEPQCRHILVQIQQKNKEGSVKYYCDMPAKEGNHGEGIVQDN